MQLTSCITKGGKNDKAIQAGKWFAENWRDCKRAKYQPVNHQVLH